MKQVGPIIPTHVRSKHGRARRGLRPLSERAASMLTSGVVKREAIPHEPGEWLEVRQLGWTALREAREKKAIAVMQAASGMDRKFLAEVREAAREAAQEASVIREATVVAQDATADALDSYDAAMLLNAGIVAWSYAAKVTPAAIADLDEVTADWAVRLVLALNLPAGEAARKNV